MALTSKEALEELRDKAQLLALFMGKDAGDYLVNVDTLYNTSKQDLERLEVLEKENQELKELQELNKQGLWNLKQENEKLKKAFKILTQRIIIKTHKNFLFGGRHLDIANTTMKLTDEEYELLKEVLGDAEVVINNE